MFKKATKKNRKVRMAISGASGSGKTMTALKIAESLATPIAVIDTERGSASLYCDKFDFSVVELTHFHPNYYIEAIKAAEAEGFKTIIIDSFSAAWYWELAEVDKSKSSFAGWKNVRPLERKLIDAILSLSVHVIVTMRSKTEYVIEKDGKNRNVPKKVGTTPVQATGVEYEFDIVGELDANNILTISKSRCAELSSRSFELPGQQVAEILKSWLSQIEPPKATEAQLTMLCTIANNNGLGIDTDLARIIKKYGYASKKDILREHVDSIKADLEKASNFVSLSQLEQLKQWRLSHKISEETVKQVLMEAGYSSPLSIPREDLQAVKDVILNRSLPTEIDF